MTPQRRFQILDALVLVAASAIGIAWSLAWARGWWRPWKLLALNVHDFCDFFTFFLVPWTLAFILLRISMPRPSLRRLGQSPGTAACLTVLIVFVIGLVEALTSWGLQVLWLRLKDDSVSKVTEVLLDVTSESSTRAGPSVLAVWLILALIRRFRLQRDWIELLGLTLSIGWIVLIFEQPIANMLSGLPESVGGGFPDQ
jgi:hypothetical protein